MVGQHSPETHLGLTEGHDGRGPRRDESRSREIQTEVSRSSLHPVLPPVERDEHSGRDGGIGSQGASPRGSRVTSVEDVPR